MREFFFSQISTYFELYVSNLLISLFKNYNTQHSLLKNLELRKKALDKRKYIGAIFMDLSKVFDILNHDLSITKLETYGFSKTCFNYLSNRLQRANVSIISIYGKISLLVFHKDLSVAAFGLTYIFMTYFVLLIMHI